MATWMDRCKAGDRAAVWAEMQSLGPDIRQPKHWRAAQSVAADTMERCRRNVLKLFECLPKIGYRFLGAAEPAVPDYVLELRIQGALAYVAATGGKRHRGDPWSHAAFGWLEDEEIELPAHHRQGRPARANYRPAGARAAAMLDEIEVGIGGPLPLAVRCWFEKVGSVDLAGTHPMLNRTGQIAALRLVLEPGGAGLTAGADAGAPFVESVRQAFAWGGFPGWAGAANAPQRELDWLRGQLEAV